MARGDWIDPAQARETFAAGTSPVVISRAIGHGSIAVTYDVYGHILPDDAADLADALDTMHTDAVARGPAVVRAIDAR